MTVVQSIIHSKESEDSRTQLFEMKESSIRIKLFLKDQKTQYADRLATSFERSMHIFALCAQVEGLRQAAPSESAMRGVLV